MMLQWTGRERIRNGWINDVSLSLSLSTHSWTQNKRCKKLLHSWLHRVWVSLTGVQWWMSISCSLISSLEFTKVFVYCPDTWDRNLLPSLSTHTLTSSTFTPFSTFNSRMKDPFYPPLKASSLSLFCKFYPQNMLHGTLRVYETLYFRCKHP